ncbi:MAG: hypothetical protein KDA84_18205 [Planctomycetaceae bacterium]|nr:hypothetical protein [Planctomycetaceae bacterium]
MPGNRTDVGVQIPAFLLDAEVLSSRWLAFLFLVAVFKPSTNSRAAEPRLSKPECVVGPRLPPYQIRSPGLGAADNQAVGGGRASASERGVGLANFLD